MSVEAKGRPYVFEKELDRIRVRREVAYGRVDDSDQPPVKGTRFTGNDTTGIALSGGGVRSAAFSLGFLQGLYRAGRMKAVDYLSTVSGGGYAGAFFSTQVVEQDKVDWEKDGKHDRLSLETNRDGTPSEAVSRLGMHGRMMGNFLELFSRHLWGFLVNVVFTVSGVVAIAALLAYLMRIVWNPSTMQNGWSPGAMDITAELGFRTDVTKPFFFAFLAFCIWILSHAFSKAAKVLGKRPVALTRYTYLLFVASIILGVLTLLAISDVGITTWVDDFGLDPSLSGRINTVLQWLATGLSAVFAAMLLPYLSPKRLLQSGQASAGNVKSLIFRMAGNAALIGVPLFLFFFLAHENISGETASRPNADQISRSHIGLMCPWTRTLESQTLHESPVKKELGHRLLAALNGHGTWTESRPDDDQIPVRKDPLKRFWELDSQRKEADSKLNFARRWFYYLESFVRPDGDYEKRMALRRETMDTSEQVATQLNRLCLSDPRLFTTLPGSPSPNANGGATEFGDRPSDPASDSALEGVPVIAKRGRVSASVDSYLAAVRDALGLGKDPQSTDAPAANDPTYATNEEVLVQLDLIAKASDIENEAPSQRRKDLLKVMGDLQVGQQLIEKRFSRVVKTDSIDPNVPRALRGFCYMVLRDELTLRLGAPQKNGMPVLTRKEFDGTALTQLEEFFRDESSAFAAVSSVFAELKKGQNAGRFEIELDKERFRAWFDKESVALRGNLADIRKNNWLLLNALFPDHIRPQDTTFASIVNISDQTERLQIAAWALFVFLAVGLLSNLNQTSLHGVYRDQLARIWTPDDSMKLGELDTCSKGGPYQLINATVNRMGNRNDPDPEGRSRFLLSQLYCGTHKLGYRETSDYQANDLAVADAVAISGAALTTITTGNFLQQMILFLTNCRLGQWLRNPINHRIDRYWPSPIRALGSLLWYPDQRSFLFISDGGHLDNTGIAALLERRCRLILCLDGSYDPSGDFADLLKVLHSARGKYGLRIRPRPTNSKSDDSQVSSTLDSIRAKTTDGNSTFSESHYVTFDVEYPETDEDGNPLKATLVYCKLSVTGDEPLELVEMARSNKTFPHDPTSDQFLPADVFEAYTALGQHIASEVDELFKGSSMEEDDLPLGWNEKQPLKKPNQRTDAAVDRDSSADDGEARAPDHNELAKKAFDGAGIVWAINELHQWCEKELSRSPEMGNDDYLVALSQWSRDLGSGVKKPLLRKQFCTGLAEAVDRHANQLSRHASARLEFFNMLSMLGERVPVAREAMKRLSEMDATQEALH